MDRTQLGLGLVAGLAFAGYGAVTLRAARASLGWPTTEGVVVESGTRRPQGNSRPAQGSVASIRYRYSVDGVSYEGSLVTIAAEGDLFAGRRGTLQARYPHGSRVTVHHDPADPAFAVLEPGGGVFAAACLTVGTVLAALTGWKLSRG